MNSKVAINVYATRSFLAFDANRRFSGSSAISVLLPREDDAETTPLTIHVGENGLVHQVDEISQVGPWGDGTSTVPNMRHYQGSFEELMEDLQVLGDVVQVS